MADQPEIKQIYKHRTEAYALFIQPARYGVSRSKFYQDCARLNIVQSDKTLQLSDLLAYAKRELEPEAQTGRPLADEEHAREMKGLELREKRAKVDAAEKAARKGDGRWMETVDHETQMAAFAGRIEESLQQLTAIRLSELIYLAGGDVRRAAEVNQRLQELYAAALTEAVREQVQKVPFAAEDENEEEDADRCD